MRLGWWYSEPGRRYGLEMEAIHILKRRDQERTRFEVTAQYSEHVSEITGMYWACEQIQADTWFTQAGDAGYVFIPLSLSLSLSLTPLSFSLALYLSFSFRLPFFPCIPHSFFTFSVSFFISLTLSFSPSLFPISVSLLLLWVEQLLQWAACVNVLKANIQISEIIQPNENGPFPDSQLGVPWWQTF